MKKTKLIKISSFLMIICMMFTLCSCGGTAQSSAPAEASSAAEPNTIIKNAAIFTSDADNTIAQAMVIKDGIIEYVGDEEGAAEFENKNSEIIDMNGGTVMPSMVDAHQHVAEAAIPYYFEISLYDVGTVEAYAQAIADFVAEFPDKEVYTGTGYMRSAFDEVGPRKETLDEIVPDKPVIITSVDGHSVWVNSKAMELAGITKDTPDPDGGIIQRDPATGEPAGLLLEAAMNLVADIKPVYSKEEYKEAIAWLQGWLNERGITTVYDGMVPVDNENYYMAYQEMAEAGELTIRIRGAWHMAPEMGNEEQLMARIDKAIELSKGFTTDYFQMIGFKFFADQVLEEQTAYISVPYQGRDDGWSGMKVWDDGLMERLFTKIDKEGFQIHIHQIGDAAASYTLDVLEKVRENNGNKDTRHSFVHVQFLKDEDIQRMADLNMNAIIAPYWSVMDDYYWDLYVPAIGQEMADSMYPAESLVKAGINVATHSDFFVTEPDMGWLFYSAVTRTLPQKIFDLWYEGMDLTRTTETDVDEEYLIGPLKPYDERMSLEEIVKAATYGGAYACFMEDEIGSIEVGKKADLVMLEQNIFDIDIEDVANITPMATMFDGEIVFQQN